MSDPIHSQPPETKSMDKDPFYLYLSPRLMRDPKACITYNYLSPRATKVSDPMHPEGPVAIYCTSSYPGKGVPQKHGLKKYGMKYLYKNLRGVPQRKNIPHVFFSRYLLAKKRPPHVPAVLQPSSAPSDHVNKYR